MGKYLRLHPVSGRFGRYDREIDAAGGIPLTSVCDQFHRLDAHGYGAWIETPAIHLALAASSAPGIGHMRRACAIAPWGRTTSLPRIAGTDPHGERFGARGVFIADGSLLPTAPWVNPQERFFALSTIVSERIASRFKAG